MIRKNGYEGKMADKKTEEKEKQRNFQNRLQKEISARCIFLSYDCYGALKAKHKTKRL